MKRNMNCCEEVGDHTGQAESRTDRRVDERGSFNNDLGNVDCQNDSRRMRRNLFRLPNNSCLQSETLFIDKLSAFVDFINVQDCSLSSVETLEKQ